MRAGLILAVLILAVGAAPASQRSGVQLRAFKRDHPCPSTGARRGSCPGYVIDHIEPLCAGGPDHRTNMQWQTLADGRRKDVLEARQCAALRGRRHQAP